MKALRRIRLFMLHYERDLVAVAGLACIGVGLATLSIAVALVVVGAFLLFASGSGRRKAR